MSGKISQPIVVAVSGGFDPLHIGHVRMFQEAKKAGDKLIVIINNDHWLRKKKGHEFMPQEERVEIIKALECVDEVILTNHSENPADMSVCESLRQIKPNIFANGGDRKEDNTPEHQVCAELGIKMIFNIGGGKIQSSSWLISRSK
ncbi:MAG TPA: adenylyltransferase/cytidyltransferase family protein [Candidatus Nanoarchaeia archaeon]|nr:adenylyltransferase/cytidyltransferase family protein [Candidatus Nanoarchaeia archaeon]